MLDGVSADHLADHPRTTPHLNALARDALLVERLAPEKPATSLPGRASILTGVDASEHGISGNMIWDGERFRYANPDDVRAPSIAAHALGEGLDVAIFGFGMARPEDATTFVHAWWANEMLQRGRDEEPTPADEGWLRTSRHVDQSGRLAELAALGLDAEVVDAYAGDSVHYRLAELAGDRQMLRWSAAALTELERRPNLLLTEVLVPDSIQHAVGQGHPFADWAIAYADALVGELMRQFDAADAWRDTTLVVLSDHGHGPVTGGLYLDTLLPGVPCAAEGGTLFAKIEHPRERQQIAARLAEHGVRPYDEAPLPSDRRDEIAVFLAPPGVVFTQGVAKGAAPGSLGGPAPYRSGHGFAPGSASDERFMLVRGPGIAPRRVARAAAEDVASTLAALAGLSPFGRGRALV